MVKRTNSNPNNAMAACGWVERDRHRVLLVGGNWWNHIQGENGKLFQPDYPLYSPGTVQTPNHWPRYTLSPATAGKKKKNFYRVSTCEWMLSERCCDTLQPQHIALISASWAFQWQRLERSLSHSLCSSHCIFTTFTSHLLLSAISFYCPFNQYITTQAIIFHYQASIPSFEFSPTWDHCHTNVSNISELTQSFAISKI